MMTESDIEKPIFDFYDDIEVWRHGDYISISENGGVIVYGRSDATLNPGGVRIGTAEIYRVVSHLNQIEDSVAIARQHGGDVDILLFVKLGEGEFSEELSQSIKKSIRQELTPVTFLSKSFPSEISHILAVGRSLNLR